MPVFGEQLREGLDGVDLSIGGRLMVVVAHGARAIPVFGPARASLQAEIPGGWPGVWMKGREALERQGHIELRALPRP